MTHAGYLHNVITPVAMNMKTPYEVLTAYTLDNSEICMFSCASNLPMHKSTPTLKLADHSEVGIYLGHEMDYSEIIYGNQTE